MDAFAVSICKGISLGKPKLKDALIVGAYFGIFQGLMPLIGYFLANSFSNYIEAFDHWIAFVLLVFIGGKMIYEAFSEEEDCDSCDQLNIKELFVLAVATSIDALAVGITFAFLKVNIAVSVTFIGVITAFLSAIGVPSHFPHCLIIISQRNGKVNSFFKNFLEKMRCS